MAVFNRKKGYVLRGFTLIEIMIAMTIFVIFLGVMIDSYTGIVRGFKETNDYRVMYSEARRVFDKITEEVRGGQVAYGRDGIIISPIKELTLYSDGEKRKVGFGFVDQNGNGVVNYTECYGSESCKAYPLNSEKVTVKDFAFFVSPASDPYDDISSEGETSEHPKVTVSATFESKLSGGKTYTFDLQTTISSRFYNAAKVLEPGGGVMGIGGVRGPLDDVLDGLLNQPTESSLEFDVSGGLSSGLLN